MNEIEAKIKVDDFNVVRVAGCQQGNLQMTDGPLYERRIIDKYYDRDDSWGSPELFCSDRFLRVRQVVVDNGDWDLWKITYKGENIGEGINDRQEIEFQADKGACELFGVLGYKLLATIDKVRKVYKFNGCEVCFDDVVNLGKFIEIEGPSKTVVGQTISQLGLESYELINMGYVQLLLNDKHLDWHG